MGRVLELLLVSPMVGVLTASFSFNLCLGFKQEKQALPIVFCLFFWGAGTENNGDEYGGF